MESKCDAGIMLWLGGLFGGVPVGTSLFLVAGLAGRSAAGQLAGGLILLAAITVITAGREIERSCECVVCRVLRRSHAVRG